MQILFFFLLLVHGHAFSETIDFGYPQAIKDWLKVTAEPLQLTVYDSFEGNAQISVNRLLEKGEWKIEKVTDYRFGHAFPSIAESLQISQNPFQMKKITTNSFYFISRTDFPNDHLVVRVTGPVSEGYNYLDIFYNIKDTHLAEDISKKISLEMYENSIFRGGVVELKENGSFGFLRDVDGYRFDWDAFILESNLKHQIRTTIEEFLNGYEETKWKKFGLPLSRGVLLHGPPGTGKSLIGKILISNILKGIYKNRVTFFYVTSRHLLKKWSIREIFDGARRYFPSVIFIEDIDLIAGRDRKEREDVKNELLQQLNGAEELKGVLTIATSNFGEALDEALTRSKRLGYHYRVGYPGWDERLELFKLFTKKSLPVDLKYMDYATQSEGLNGADIKELCDQAIEEAIRNKSVDITQKVLLKDIFIQWAFLSRSQTRLEGDKNGHSH